MNIGIVGAIGVDDIGDVIMLEAGLKLLKDICNDNSIEIKLTIFALDPKLAREQIEKIGIKADVVSCLRVDELSSDIYKNFRFQDLLKINIEEKISNHEYFLSLSKCDALFFIGGGYFNKYWNDKLISTFVIPMALGYQLNKLIYISGVNIGPFDEVQINRLEGLFENVDTLILRDRIPSIEILKKLSGTKGNLLLGSDDILPRWYKKYNNDEDKIYREELKYAVVHLHHWVEKFSQNSIEFYKTLAKFLNELLDNKHLDRVYFLPFDYFKGLDYECGRRLKTYMNDREDYIVLEPTKDHIFMRQMISKSKFVIASRYHPVVFGMGEQVPTLGIYVNDLYKQKISGAYEVVNVNHDDNMIYINDFSYKGLMEWYEFIQKEKYLQIDKMNEIIDTYNINRRRSIEEFIIRVQR